MRLTWRASKEERQSSRAQSDNFIKMCMVWMYMSMCGGNYDVHCVLISLFVHSPGCLDFIYYYGADGRPQISEIYFDPSRVTVVGVRRSRFSDRIVEPVPLHPVEVW